MESHYCLPAIPRCDPIWRGILVITNEVFGPTYGIAAHLSSSACEKVQQMAVRFPALLYSEVVPKLDVWPTRFTRSPPTENDIAVYFFAENGNDQLFESLLSDLTGRDVAFKVHIDKVELLIFTSSQLPTQHQPIEGKSYLWGVFRPNKAPLSHHLINMTMSIMPLNPINAPSSVIQEDGELIKMSNNVNGTRNMHHEDGRRSDCDKEEAAAVDKVEPIVIADHAHVESSVRDDYTCVKSCINADNSIVDTSVNPNNSLMESLINADKTLVESCTIADHTQGADPNNLFEAKSPELQTEDLLQHASCENQLLSDSNHSRNTTSPVLSSPIIIFSEEALTQGPMPIVAPTAVPPVISSTQISEIPLSQFQDNSVTPSVKGDEGGITDCTISTAETCSHSMTYNLHDLAKIFDDIDSHEASTQGSVKVGRYTIKQNLSSVLESILVRYGDIAQDSQLPNESTSHVMELICEVVQNLQVLSLKNLRSRHLKCLNTIVTEAKSVKIEVDWLKSRHDELVETLCMRKCYPSLKVSIYATIKVAESTEGYTALKKAELAEAQSEYQSMENKLTSLEAEFQSRDPDIWNMVSKCKRFLEKPLNDGLR